MLDVTPHIRNLGKPGAEQETVFVFFMLVEYQHTKLKVTDSSPAEIHFSCTSLTSEKVV